MYRIELKDSILELKPSNNIRKVYIELTSLCNFSCEMCFRNSFREKYGSMTMETFTKILKDLKKFSVKEVVFGGIGEPLANKHFKEMASLVREEGYRLLIESNGGLFDDKMIDFIFEKDVNEIIFSSEPGNAGHKSYKEILDITQKISDRVRDEKRGYPVVSIQTVLTTENLNNLQKYVKHFIDAGASRLILSNIIPTSEKELHLPLYVDPDKNMEKKISEIITGKIMAELPYFELKTERFCNFVQNNSVVIRWDGEVAPCYRFLHSYDEYVYGIKKSISAVSFGNINKDSLENIWKSKDFAFFRFKVNHSMYPSCTDCRLRDGCNFVETSEYDCWANSPSCGDCLWWRGLVVCP